MKELRLLLFAGTYHGRQLCEELLKRGATVYVSSFSQMGDDRLPRHKNCHRFIGPIDAKAVEAWNEDESFHGIIDATHPYATGIRIALIEWAKKRYTRNPKALTIPMLRYERPTSIQDDEGIFFDSMEELCCYVSNQAGKILFTTGVRQMPIIMRYLHKERVICRILDAEASVQDAYNVGLTREQLIIANPPFSVEDTGRLIESQGIDYVVTKDGGSVGGTREKVAACEQYQAKLLVLRRPVVPDMKAYIEEATTLENVMAWVQSL